MDRYVFGRAFTRQFLLLVMFVLAASSFQISHAADEPMDEYEPPPEGFEERHYAVVSLLQSRLNFMHSETGPSCPPLPDSSATPLSAEQIIEILKYCVQPDIWTRRGPARIQINGTDLVVLHRKEAHAEIAKVLKWLSEGAAAACRTTVVVANLKPEALKKIVDAGVSATPAEIFKAIEEAGDAANAEIVELSGAEGQKIVASGTSRQQYVHDFDLSGAVYDPVIRTAHTGLLVHATATRTPDGKAAQIELQVSQRRTLEMNKAQIALDGPVKSAEILPAQPEKKDEKKDEKPQPPKAPAELLAGKMKSNLEISLPSQITAVMATTVTAARGVFVLAGTFDLNATGQGKAAVFVRSVVGIDGVPTLEGVSGLKDGESFRLYSIQASTGFVRDFPGPMLWLQPQIVDYISVGTSAFDAGTASPFSAPAAQGLPLAITKTKQMFAEKVRKNKIVEPMGPFIFTRLNNEDHAKLSATLSEDLRRRAIPARFRAVALAVPPAIHRKLIIEGSGPIDAAALDALAQGAGVQLLAESHLSVPLGARSNIAAGRVRNVVTDYEISGDGYDPVISQVLDQGYAFDVKGSPGVDENSTEVETRFCCVPGAVVSDRTTLDTFSVNSGANMELAFGMRADLDRLKAGIIEIKGNTTVPNGKYVLAGASRMPAGLDGKADGRQVLVFVGAEVVK